MNGLGDHDHRRPAPEAVRLLDRRRRLRRRGAAFVQRPRRDRTRPRSWSASPCSSCCSCCRGSRPRSRPCWSRSSAPRSSRRCSTSPPTAWRPSARFPQGFPTPALPWTSLSDVGPLLVAAIGITLVSLTDTIATSSSFAARRGDEVEPNQEMIGIGAANIAAGFFQGFAVSTSGSRTAVAEQSGAKSQLTGVVGAGLVVAAAAVLQLAARRPAAVGARGRRDRRGALADGLSARSGRYCAGAASRARRCRWWPRSASSFFGVLEGIVVAIVLSVLLFFRRSWWPHGDGARPRRRHRGLAQRRAAPRRREELPGIVVYRWEAPLFFANAGAFRRQIRHLVRDAPARVGRAAVRGDHRHRRHRRRDARAARQRAQRRRASTSRSSRCAAASRTSSTATACSTPSTATTSTPARRRPRRDRPPSTASGRGKDRRDVRW